MVRNWSAFLFVIVFPLLACAQQDYKGRVLDAKTNTPIPYVNIGVVDRGIGTVSQEDGLFHLSLDKSEFGANDKVLFSSLGYENLEIPISEIVFAYNEYPEVRLQPKIEALNEVIVTNVDGEFVADNIGYKNGGETVFGYWKDNVALGGQLATRIRVKKGLRKLKELGFEIWSSTSDSVLVRINFYDVTSFGIPGQNLNTSSENILYTIKRGQRFADIDLTPYSIYVKDDFVVSLELLKVYGGEELGLIMAAINFDTDSFRKFASQDEWETLPNSAMAYYLKSSLLLSTKAAERSKKKKQRKESNQTIISGFSIYRGRMLAKVGIRNLRTKELIYTDSGGHFRIHARPRDILCFRKPGYETKCYEIGKKLTLNAQMRLANE